MPLWLCFFVFLKSVFYPYFLPSHKILYCMESGRGLYAGGTLNQDHDHQGGASSGWSEGKTVP